MHAIFAAAQKALGWDAEFRLNNGRRVDALNAALRVARELKPNNPRAIKRGLEQLRKYLEQLQNRLGKNGQERYEHTIHSMKNINGPMAALNSGLKVAGFLKLGKTWRKETDYGCIVFELQKSQYDLPSYVNTGLILPIHNSTIEVKHVHNCDIYGRFDRLSPSAAKLVNQLPILKQEADIQAWCLKLSDEINNINSTVSLKLSWKAGRLTMWLSSSEASDWLDQ